MRKALALFAIVLTLGMAAVDAEARRLGGARSSGMQRQQVTQPNTPPATQPNAPSQAAPAAGTAAAAAPAAAAATKRSWAGPLMGLAAGLGLAALASYLGFGEELAMVMMIALLAMVALAVIGFIMRKRAGASPAMAGAGGHYGNQYGATPDSHTMARSPLGNTRIGSALRGHVAPASTLASPIPADFDKPAFERNAKAQFMALQEANDARDLQRLRDYLTPEMYEVVREEVESRGDATQKTEVFGLDTQVLEVVEEADRYIVSVRFRGSVREQMGAAVEDLDEVWHLVKPRSGFGGWQVAGIQQVEG